MRDQLSLAELRSTTCGFEAVLLKVSGSKILYLSRFLRVMPLGCPLGCPREAPVLVWCLFPLVFYNIAQADCFFKRQTYTRRGADIIRLLNRLLRFRIHVVECVIYNGGQRIGAVVFHLSILLFQKSLKSAYLYPWPLYFRLRICICCLSVSKRKKATDKVDL